MPPRLTMVLAVVLPAVAACGRMGFDAAPPDQPGEPATAANRAPVATGGSAVVLDPTAPLRIDLDAGDADGDLLGVVVLEPPASGTLVVDPDAARPTVRYLAAAGFVGVDTFAYAVTDGQAYSGVVEHDVAVPPARAFAAATVPLPVAACGTFSTPGTYRLTHDLVASGDCLTIASSDVIILGDGHRLTTTAVVGARGVTATGVAAVQVHDLEVVGFETGVAFTGCTGCLVRGVSAVRGRATADGLGVLVEAGSDDVDLDGVTVDGFATGVLVTASDRTRLLGLAATAVAGPAVHFYDEASDAWLLDTAVTASGRGASCDRCQRLTMVGARLTDLSDDGVAFVLAADGHLLADVTVERAPIGLEFEHWGGCDDVRVQNSRVLGATDVALRFAAGSAHTGLVLHNVSWDATAERNESASSYRREGLGLVHLRDADGEPLAAAAIRWRDAISATGMVVVDADGLSPRLTLPLYDEVGGARTTLTPYALEHVDGAPLAVALPLDGSLLELAL